MKLQELVDQIKQTYVELGFASRWSLIQMYHEIGRLLASQVTENLETVANLSGISERSLQRSLQFYRKYPELELLPDGKNISWHKIVNKYLPVPKNAEVAELAEVESEEKLIKCPQCNFSFPVDK